MTTTIIAVLGTLAGALLSGVLGHLSQRAQLKAQADHTRRTESLAAVTDLVAALADHRRAMWVREDARLRGEDWGQARAESHATRSAITAPLLRVQMLLPTLSQAAQDAARATYDMRGRDHSTALAAAREKAIERTDAFVAAAGAALSA